MVTGWGHPGWDGGCKPRKGAGRKEHVATCPAVVVGPRLTSDYMTGWVKRSSVAGETLTSHFFPSPSERETEL